MAIYGSLRNISHTRIKHVLMGGEVFHTTIRDGLKRENVLDHTLLYNLIYARKV